MIYMDNAATTYKKPDTVCEEVLNALRYASGNPGRSGHSISRKAAQIVGQTRMDAAKLFHLQKSDNLIFTLNATDALNLAIHGIVRPGSHVITSCLEHNSVARPLEVLKNQGVRVTVLPASVDDGIDPEDLEREICPETSLVVLTHISNVTGTVNDIRSAGEICRRKGVPFLMDAAQSAGGHPIDVEKDCIDLLAFPGHKGLLGPGGTGGLYIRPGLQLQTLRQGGTGSISESLMMPETLPDRYESGTVNVHGIAGLGAGIRYILDTGLDVIEQKEAILYERLWEGLRATPGVTLYSPEPGKPHGCVISAAFENITPQDMGAILDSEFEICVRAGLHCAPYAHRMLGTIETYGTVRFSPNHMNTIEEVDETIVAVREILREF